MRTVRPLLAVGLFLALAGFTAAQGDAEKAIVGKWQATKKAGDKEIKLALEFTKEGKLTMSSDIFALSGTYRFLDAETLEVTFKVGEKDMTQKSRVKVAGDELTVTNPDGEVTRLTRVK